MTMLTAVSKSVVPAPKHENVKKKKIKQRIFVNELEWFTTFCATMLHRSFSTCLVACCAQILGFLPRQVFRSFIVSAFLVHILWLLHWKKEKRTKNKNNGDRAAALPFIVPLFLLSKLYVRILGSAWLESIFRAFRFFVSLSIMCYSLCESSCKLNLCNFSQPSDRSSIWQTNWTCCLRWCVISGIM